jgi:hypothetical protein
MIALLFSMSFAWPTAVNAVLQSTLFIGVSFLKGVLSTVAAHSVYDVLLCTVSALLPSAVYA